ncbi:MAG TPA: hypothetical protein VF546_15505 [Pyrinomonadaceae bacterium]|jgi:hypothetical protein
MARFKNPLAQVRVAAPCQADWNEMRGDERVRFCAHCRLNVYNLSALTRPDAEWLVTRAEGRRCVRYFQRPDGTIITQDCPAALRALRRRVSKFAGMAFAAVTTLLVGLGVGVSPRGEEPAPVAATAYAAEPVEPEGVAVAGMMSSSPLAATGEPFLLGGLLASGLFIVGYPLHKLRERNEAKRRAALRIWRRDEER